MRISLISAFLLAIVLSGCASHPRDFVPNGAAGANLPPTNPAHIQVLDSVPRGMVIGTVLVDRSKAANTAAIIDMARQKAAAVGGDFIVWEDSLGTSPAASPAAGAPSVPDPNSGAMGHSASLPEPAPEQVFEKAPQARFTVGIFLPEGHPTHGQ
jgi:hypothetical protein